MNWVRWATPLLLTIALVAAGCGGDNGSSSSNAAGDSSAASSGASNADAGTSGASGDDAGGEDGSLPAGVPAQVGKKTISQAALRERLNIYYGGKLKAFGPPHYTGCVKARKAERTGESPAEILNLCKLTYQSAANVALGTLLQAEWLDREAKRQGIDVTPDVRKAVARAKRLREFARTHHPKIPANEREPLRIINSRRQPPLPDLASSTRTAAQQQRLMAAIPLTEQAIKDYGNANGDVFLESEDRTGHFLQTNTRAKAQSGRRDLEHHSSWAQVQTRYKSKRYAGHDWTGTKTITKGSAPADAVGRSLFAAKPHVLTGPVHTLNGWFIFEVTTIKPPKHRRLTPIEHGAVASTIRSQRLAEILYDHYAKETTCRPEFETQEAPQCQ